MDMGHRKGVASTLYNIGKVAFQMGHYQQAKELCLESITGLRELGEKWSLANWLAGLGRASVALELHNEARENYRESLAIARELDAMILIEQAVVGIAELMEKTGDASRALELASMVANRPARSMQVQDRAEALSTYINDTLTSVAASRVLARGQQQRFDDVVEE